MKRPCLLLVLLALGCTRVPEVTTPPAPEPGPSLGAKFNPKKCGTLVGQLRWHYQPPVLKPILAPRRPGNLNDESPPRWWPNPNAPEITPAAGVRGVVFLRGVDPERSRPFALPPVRVEVVEEQLHVIQGDRQARVGFVRRGQAVEFVSREAEMHLIRARGASHFGQPLTRRDVVRPRTLHTAGVVELSSGVGCFWHRAHLFVVEHPYYALTDAEGNYRFEQVPEGHYEVVAWLPNWREIDHDRNGDTGFRTETEYAEPLTRSIPARVVSGLTTTVNHLIFTAE